MAARRSIDNENSAPSARIRTRVIRVLDETGEAVCPRCAVAGTVWARTRGLLGRDGLAEDEGLLIEPAPSVHMFFMRFAIDVVFLDKERRIVGLAHTLRPWRVAGARKAVAALELPAGTALRHGLELGDVLAFEPV
jgi:uncharacterized membrane protein (UPF0127 family)